MSPLWIAQGREEVRRARDAGEHALARQLEDFIRRKQRQAFPVRDERAGV